MRPWCLIRSAIWGIEGPESKSPQPDNKNHRSGAPDVGGVGFEIDQGRPRVGSHPRTAPTVGMALPWLTAGTSTDATELQV